jgi:hypothetical protein
MSDQVRQQWIEWWKHVTAKSSVSDLDLKFIDFHMANPQVYTELVSLSREAKGQGHSKFGLRMLWEVLRWKRMMSTTDPSEYKLNDNYISRYARLIMSIEKDLDGLFEIRGLKS